MLHGTGATEGGRTSCGIEMRLRDCRNARRRNTTHDAVLAVQRRNSWENQDWEVYLRQTFATAFEVFSKHAQEEIVCSQDSGLEKPEHVDPPNC